MRLNPILSDADMRCFVYNPLIATMTNLKKFFFQFKKNKSYSDVAQGKRLPPHKVIELFIFLDMNFSYLLY